MLEDCLFVGPSFQQGIHTRDLPAMERGGFALTDVRAGYVFRGGPFYWMLGGGAGWVWRADLPVLLVASGIGVGRRVRLGLDWEWLGYRMRWNSIEEEWLNGEVVREISRSEWHDWRSGYSIRLSLEIAPVTFH